MFLYHNYDMLLISIQSLDPYGIDKLINQSYKIDLVELFAIRTKSIMRYTEISKCNNLYYIFVLTYNLSTLLCSSNIQQHAREILQDISQHYHDSSLYSNITKNYIQRFTLNYRKSCNPYLVGHYKYSSNKWIIQLSIINLFLMYKMSEKNGIYFIFYYMIHNYRQV
uniref:Uncharacterized protein n=1 Tax=Neoizziella asiatica TaxID=1077397 RepID=A0A1G4NX99_9FLOR|nr:Hypothetical protein ORF_6 [Neoizziella asiatica]SCW23282.1 Hypothetical protein ORF_6 [Neoizziella asiatica]